MRLKHLITLVVLLLFSLEVSLASDTSEGLVLNYEFENDSLDSSSIANHATNNGANFVLDRNGDLNSALSFDGNDFLVAQDNSGINFGEKSFTLAGWIKTNFSSNTQAIFWKGTDGTSSTGTAFYVVQMLSNGKVSFQVADGSLAQDSVLSTSAINDGEWHHVVAMRDVERGKLILYVDGEQDANSIVSLNNSINNSNTLKIGKLHQGQERFFNGEMDELAGWNRALDEDEINDLFENGVSNCELDLICNTPPLKDSLVALYSLDNNSEDSSHSENHAINNGASFVLDRDAISNSALSFDGNDFLEAQNNDAINFGNGSFTLAGWVKTDFSSNTQAIFWKGTDGTSSTGTAFYVVQMLSNGKVSFQVADGSLAQDSVLSTTSINDGEWHHVVALRDMKSGKLKMYIDGVEDASSTVTITSSIDNTNTLKIGKLHQGQERFFNGEMDDLAMWNKALSKEQIKTLAEHYNVIIGDRLANTISSNSLKDHIFGKGGKDVIDGGSNDDILNGQGDDDTLTGGLGRDTIRGGAGDDRIILSSGDVPALKKEGITGNSGNDTLVLNGFNSSSIVGSVPNFTVIDPSTGGTYNVKSVENIEFN